MLNLGSFTLPRLNAHRVVLAAAALTTLVAAALATTLVVFSDQALPHTVRQRLTAASGTSMIVTALELAWADGGYYGFCADGAWSAMSSAGDVLTGNTPDALTRKIRAHWQAMQ